MIQAESYMDQDQHPTYSGLRQIDILDRFLRRFKEEEAIRGIINNAYIGNGLYIVLRLLYGEFPKIFYKYHQL